MHANKYESDIQRGGVCVSSCASRAVWDICFIDSQNNYKLIRQI